MPWIWPRKAPVSSVIGIRKKHNFRSEDRRMVQRRSSTTAKMDSAGLLKLQTTAHLM